MMNAEHWKLYGEKSASKREKERGHLRMNLVLSPEDTALVGKIMKRYDLTRMEAIRCAIRMASHD